VADLATKLALLEALKPYVEGTRDQDVWRAAWERAWKDTLEAARRYVES
jgi:hypothetical protein